MQNRNTDNNLITLYGVKISPYVRKVLIFLHETKIKYELIETLPSSFKKKLNVEDSEVFQKASTIGKIPAITVGNFSLSDSSIINQYLDNKFRSKESPYPHNIEEKHQALWYERYSDTILSDVIYKKIFTEIVVKPSLFNEYPNNFNIDKIITEELLPELNFLDNSLKNNKWLLGDTFTIADIAVISQLLCLKMSDINLGTLGYPSLLSYQNRLLERKSIKNILS